MHATQLDTWTKHLARTALEGLQGSLAGPATPPLLLGQVSQRVREVLSRDLAVPAADPPSRLGLAEEIALAVYLTVAAESHDTELTPELLGELNLGLARKLEELATRVGGTTPRDSATTDRGGTV